TLSISALLFVLIISIHTVNAQTRVGIRAGMNLSGIHLTDEPGERQDTETVPRFQIGLTLDVPVATDFYIQPAALYSGKGFKQDGGWLVGPDNTFKATVSYFEVPVNLLYTPQLGPGNLIVGAGPYVAYGTGGRWKADQGHILIGDIMIEPQGDVIFKDDVADGEFGNYLYGKPWDYGVNFLVGYKFFRRITVQVNGQFGVANITPDIGGENPKGNTKNKVYGISIGYNL